MNNKSAITPTTPLAELQALCRSVAAQSDPADRVVPERMVRSIQQSLSAAGYEVSREDIVATFDPLARQREKQASRDQDEADLASGRKTREQLWRENSAFAFPHVLIDFDAKIPLL